MTTRIFLMGMIIFFVGIQLRMVETFVLNERATKIVNSRTAAASQDPYAATYYDPYALDDPLGTTATRKVTPPRWLGWSFLSIGAVLIVTCPCFRT